MILSATEIQNALKVSSVDAMTTVIHLAVESWVKAQTGRNFEQTAFTDQAHDVDIDQDILFLSDQPVTTFTSLKEVQDRDSNGVPSSTRTVPKDEYLFDANAGIVQSLVGPFRPGVQTMLATYQAGYTSGEITGNSKDEVKIAKQLILSITQREWKLTSLNQRHMLSVNFGEESTLIMFDITQFERKMLNSLKLWPALK